jgi:hypothetical protein
MAYRGQAQEAAFMKILDGLESYAKAHRRDFEVDIGDDYVLGPAWLQIAGALQDLLDGEIGRIDAGKMDGHLRQLAYDLGFDNKERGEVGLES